MLVEHSVSSVIAADFLQVYSTVRNCRFISIMIMIIIFLIPQVVKIPRVKKLKSKCRMVIGPAGQLAECRAKARS